MTSEPTLIVVPCYNEAARLPVDRFVDFAKGHPDVQFLLVNDGSRDDTLALLRRLESEHPENFEVLDQQPNQGKAAAVRAGMAEALKRRAAFAGYWDADLSTPLDELPRFVAVLRSHPERDIVFGARVQLLGRSIARVAARHYMGRLFATLASLALGVPVYDTQCGAKLFRGTPEMEALFREPFASGWIFDVELIARILAQQRASGGPGPEELIYELPLRRWTDVPGSKVRAADFAVALADLWRIRRRYLRR
jgi:glycosyltransferase involved in cell wall biosynthesis